MTFSVRLTNEQRAQLDKLFSIHALGLYKGRSSRFRRLLVVLLAARAPVVSMAEQTRLDCNFDDLVTGHRDWLENHFPKSIEIQSRVAELLAEYEAGTDWRHAAVDLRAELKGKPLKPLPT